MALFVHRIEVGTDDAKGLGSGQGCPAGAVLWQRMTDGLVRAQGAFEGFASATRLCAGFLAGGMCSELNQYDDPFCKEAIEFPALRQRLLHTNSSPFFSE